MSQQNNPIHGQNFGPLAFLNEFFKKESAGGLLLMGAAALALIIANTGLDTYYQMLLSTPVKVSVGALEVGKPLLLWINDGLMAVFFFMVGLELKRELMEGELSDLRKVVLPGVGAVGGMVLPVLIFTAFNLHDPVSMQGWAIPAATDIAFALGILSLLGKRVPIAIKVFLISLAIFDDIGAVVIIALFFTSKLSVMALVVALACIPVLWYMNYRNFTSKSPYILVGIIMWTATLKSGVHATLAGVVLAMFIPMRSKVDPEYSPLKNIEHDLHKVVAFFILPVFAFANAGIDLRGMEIDQFLHSVPLGI
ncbi:MAG: Na+/H+ antiporter NhaA, partial [Bacteroidota bacterium]